MSCSMSWMMVCLCGSACENCDAGLDILHRGRIVQPMNTFIAIAPILFIVLFVRHYRASRARTLPQGTLISRTPATRESRGTTITQAEREQLDQARWEARERSDEASRAAYWAGIMKRRERFEQDLI